VARAAAGTRSLQPIRFATLFFFFFLFFFLSFSLVKGQTQWGGDVVEDML
jgi:hypothetical protein